MCCVDLALKVVLYTRLGGEELQSPLIWLAEQRALLGAPYGLRAGRPQTETYGEGSQLTVNVFQF